MGTITVTVTVHSYLDPACHYWAMNGSPRVPAWLRRLLGWNCAACAASPSPDTETGDRHG